MYSYCGFADHSPAEDLNSNNMAYLNSSKYGRVFRILLLLAAIAVLFAIYTFGIASNPPGFYIDESGFGYNAFLVSRTGAGEFGSPGTIFFQFYTGGFTQYTSPTLVYMLAAVYWFFGPSIIAARLLTAASMFTASLLIGGLGARISGRRLTGIIIGLCALLTPWLFEVGRLVLDTFFYPMAVILFLWAVYRAYKKDAWTAVDILLIVLTLALLTYSYTIGRLLAPLLAFGLIVFATNKKRIIAIAKTWLAFAVTLVPLISYIYKNPDFTTRFYLLSYVKPGAPWMDTAQQFIGRFVEELNPIQLLWRGDINPRHHIPDALGSFYISAYVLAMLGIVVILFRHRRNSWWLYLIYGLAASIVPGALTVDVSHTLRLIGVPVFLLLLMVPAIEFLVTAAPKASAESEGDDEEEVASPMPKSGRAWAIVQPIRYGIIAIILAVMCFEAAYFHKQYYLKGPNRGYVFDSAYKELYDAAVAQPVRPIYLVDGYWGPDYIHAFWYATVEGRNTGEFIHQPYRLPVPAGSIVISSDRECIRCEMIRRNGDFILYKTIN